MKRKHIYETKFLKRCLLEVSTADVRMKGTSILFFFHQATVNTMIIYEDWCSTATFPSLHLPKILYFCTICRVNLTTYRLHTTKLFYMKYCGVQYNVLFVHKCTVSSSRIPTSSRKQDMFHYKKLHNNPHAFDQSLGLTRG